MPLASTPRKHVTRTVPSRKGRGEGGKHWNPGYVHSHLLPFGAWTSGSSPGQASSGSARKQEGPGRSAHRRGGGGSTLAGSGDGDGGVKGKSQGELQRLGQLSSGHLIQTSWGEGDPQSESKLSQYLGSI